MTRLRLLHSQAVQSIVCFLIALYIRLVWVTSRFDTIGGEEAERFWRAGSPFILAFWHGRLLMAPKAWAKGAPMNMLISGHRDGRIIAGAIAYFGLGSISGSRGKSGAGALRAMVRALGSGENVGVTPDGPRGPAMRATAGIVAAARLSGAPILPLAYATTRRRILATWDHFHIALPFSRGVFVWGAPIEIPRDADPAAQEMALALLEAGLNAATETADQFCGHTPFRPGAQAGAVDKAA
jgi:lysophospholipid acyltransferase (LPLAT)-like uncharacterized protein